MRAPLGGFGPAATAFFEALERENTREFWQANRPVFEREVREPFAALLDALPGRYPPFRILRMNRDLRFSNDKSPHRTDLGAIQTNPGHTDPGQTNPGAVDRYLHVGADGLLVACGVYQLESDQLARYRAALDHPVVGPELVGILDDLEAAGFAVNDIGPEPLKTAPRGYPRDHPRIELLRRRGLIAHRTLAGPRLAEQEALVAFVTGTYDACASLARWVGEQVGASSIRRERGR